MSISNFAMTSGLSLIRGSQQTFAALEASGAQGASGASGASGADNASGANNDSYTYTPNAPEEAKATAKEGQPGSSPKTSIPESYLGGSYYEDDNGQKIPFKKGDRLWVHQQCGGSSCSLVEITSVDPYDWKELRTSKN